MPAVGGEIAFAECYSQTPLVNAFALSLLTVAFLFFAGAAGFTEGHVIFESIRRVTFFVIGLAPLAFLVGLLQTRLLRSSVGDLVLELRESRDIGDTFANWFLGSGHALNFP